MEKNLYTIMGATGNIGHVIAQNLLMNGHQVRAIGRNMVKNLICFAEIIRE
jgi:putative NADH-flavin reductase